MLVQYTHTVAHTGLHCLSEPTHRGQKGSLTRDSELKKDAWLPRDQHNCTFLLTLLIHEIMTVKQIPLQSEIYMFHVCNYIHIISM